jgi:hypothetical protein
MSWKYDDDSEVERTLEDAESVEIFTYEENENELEKFIDYEKVFAELFRELVGLKAAQCELIRAFLIVSKGQIEFEASNYDLAKVNHKTDGSDYKRLSENVGNAIVVLEKWQKDNELTLVQQVEKGHRENADDGRFLYFKPKYKFVLLAELSEAITENPENVKEIVKETIVRLKEQFVPAEKAKSYNPRHLMKKAKNTIFTKLRKVFELAVEAGDNPIDYCQGILNDSWEVLNGLETEYTAYQNREKFIAAFESQLNTELMEDSNEMDSNI